LSRGSRTTLIDRQGVALVERIVARDLGWIFREQHVSDQGIDGQVEVAVDGRGTGRLIALQIKTGSSYFRPVNGGWAFYYSERERGLWLGHALPVMVVLVDLEADAAYWQRISPSTERRTKSRYAVTVPVQQTLASAADSWKLAASGMERRATERYEANLAALPPEVRRLIEKERSGERDSALLALHLSEGRNNPAGTAQALLAGRPRWMGDSASWSWRALGTYCAQHEARVESADALEIAAEHAGLEKGKRLAAAALHVAVVDRSRAKALVDSARAAGGAELLVAIVDAILGRPENDAHPLPVESILSMGGIDDDATAQAFLAENALRKQDIAVAARYAERGLSLQPEDSDAMARVAWIYARRSGTPEAQADDLLRATELLCSAVEQRRRWSGPTIGLLADLARVLMLLGDYGAVLRWLMPPPHGTASPREATDPVLLRYALAAAKASDNDPLGESIVAEMRGTVEDRVAQARLGRRDADDDSLRGLWSEELLRAEAEADAEAVVQAVYRLATLGVDQVGRLSMYIRDGILPSNAGRLPGALLEMHRDPAEGLIRLRALATEDLSAAEHYVGALIEAGRLQDAADACAEVYDRFRTPRFATQRARLLAHLGSPLAESALSEALLTEQAPIERLALATRLAQVAANSSAWPKAESLLSAALSYITPPPDELVWNLVGVQLGGSAGDRAASTILRQRPQCRAEADARRWAAAMVNVPWDDSIASEAIALAIRFSGDPDLATGLLTHLVLMTRGTEPGGETRGDEEVESPFAPDDDRPVVRGELHRRAFEVLDGLIREHGEASGAFFIQATSPEEMVARVSEHVRRSAPPDLSGLLDEVARGQLPAALVALANGKTYTEGLVRRAAGQLVAVAASDEEHEEEAGIAASALGGPVVVDLSTLHVLSCLSVGDVLAGRYSSLLLPRSARDDVRRAAVEVQGLGASVGTLGWDAESEKPVFHEQTSAEYRLVRQRTDAVEELVRRTSVREVPDAAALAISRPAWWSGQTDPINQVFNLFLAAQAAGSQYLGGWQHAAMLGAARSQPTLEGAVQILARLALLGVGPDPSEDPVYEDLVAGCRTARRVAATFAGAGDPVAALPAARAVWKRAGIVRPGDVVDRLIREFGADGA